MKNLLELRDEIDVIDKQIVALYQQRMQIAGEVAEYKIETGKKVFDKDREMEKLATLFGARRQRVQPARNPGAVWSRSCRSAESASIS